MSRRIGTHQDMANASAPLGPLVASLREFLPCAEIVGAESLDQAPATGGAYALLIHTGREVPFRRAILDHIFVPAWYVYAGSAYGPGGIRARLHRHFRQDKPIHWHVDHLTLAADALAAVTIEGGSECAIVSALRASRAFRPAIAGFGSSDCRLCEAHLLQFGV